jgi:hypothetical protein
MKQATEYVRGLHCKLRMMGIPVDEPTFFFEDNQSVLANTTNPTSTLKKRLNAIAYHHNNRATLHHQTHAACSLTCWLQSDLSRKLQ